MHWSECQMRLLVQITCKIELDMDGRPAKKCGCIYLTSYIHLLNATRFSLAPTLTGLVPPLTERIAQ